MKTIDNWIDEKLAIIAKALPELVEKAPSSFSCGRAAGYKQALLDLEKIILDGVELRKSLCWCRDRYHGPGVICL